MDRDLFNIDSRRREAIEAAGRIILALGLKPEAAGITRLYRDIRHFYDSNTPLRYLNRHVDLIGLKYWGPTHREHLCSDAPVWPSDFTRERIRRLFNILSLKGLFAEVTEEETAHKQSSFAASGTNLLRTQAATASFDSLQHGYSVGVGTATKEALIHQPVTCSRLPIFKSAHSTSDSAIEPSRTASPAENAFKASKPARKSGFYQHASSSMADTFKLPPNQVSTASNQHIKATAQIGTRSLAGDSDTSMQLKKSSSSNPEPTNRQSSHINRVVANLILASVTSAQKRSSSASLKIPRAASDPCSQQPEKLSPHDIDLNTSDLTVLASTGPALVDTTFANIHAYYGTDTPPCVMRVAHNTNNTPGLKLDVVLADPDGRYPSNGRVRTATVSSFEYTDRLIIWILRLDESHSYVVRSLPNSCHGTWYYRWLGLGREFAPLPSAMKIRPSKPLTMLKDASVTDTSSSNTKTRPLVKRQRSGSADSEIETIEVSRRRHQPSSSLELIHTRSTHKVDQWKQANTTLYITLSTNDYGAVPVSLVDCMTIEKFFSIALSACGLQDKESEIAAVSVSFDGSRNKTPIVVTKTVENSFQRMLKTIDEAPCWERKERSPECSVYVKIIMR